MTNDHGAPAEMTFTAVDAPAFFVPKIGGRVFKDTFGMALKRDGKEVIYYAERLIQTDIETGRLLGLEYPFALPVKNIYQTNWYDPVRSTITGLIMYHTPSERFASWANDTIGGNLRVFRGGDTLRTPFFHFKLEAHLIAFKMRWWDEMNG